MTSAFISNACKRARMSPRHLQSFPVYYTAWCANPPPPSLLFTHSLTRAKFQNYACLSRAAYPIPSQRFLHLLPSPAAPLYVSAPSPSLPPLPLFNSPIISGHAVTAQAMCPTFLTVFSGHPCLLCIHVQVSVLVSHLMASCEHPGMHSFLLVPPPPQTCNPFLG
jgi:hypothetical protein